MSKKIKAPSITKHGLIVLLLWFFAPGAWFLMWKDPRYHSWFPHLLWINGAVFSLITLVYLYTVRSGILLTVTVGLVVLSFTVLQIIAGLSLQYHLTKPKYSLNKIIAPIIAIFLVDIALGYLYVFL